LLEHPEGSDSRVFICSFGFNEVSGPVVKAARYAGQENIFRDSGLYENASEIKYNLEGILKRELGEST
jgi:hypothetical protein